MSEEFAFLESDARAVGVPEVPAVARLRTDTPDGAVSVLRFGTATPELTLLHGAGLNAHTFDRTILALGHPALSVDLPGHGRSAWRSDADYRPDTLVPAVAESLRHFTEQPQLVVGHSLGGLTALSLAARYPELVRALIILDITPGVRADDGRASIREFIAGQSSFETVDEIVDRAIAFEIGHDRDALTRGVTLNTRVRTDGRLEWTHHLAHLMATSSSDRSSKDVFNTEADLPHASLWEAVDGVVARGIPLILIRGDRGMVSDELSDEWMRRAPHSRVETASAGHNIQEHAPAELAELIRALL